MSLSKEQLEKHIKHKMKRMKHDRQWPVKDKTKYCNICGFMGTYGNGKTWNRCFTHLNTEPKPVLDRI